MSQPELLIFPRNGTGLEAVECITSSYRLAGFIDDGPGKLGSIQLELSSSCKPAEPAGPQAIAVMSRTKLAEFPDAFVLAVPGSPSNFRNRVQAIESLGLPRDRFATVIHPTASVSPNAKIGRNVLLMAGVVVTANAVIEDHVCVLPGSVVHHDSVVGAYTLVGSRVTIAGGTTIGKNCYLGSGSSIINGIQIGDRALIGLGAVVIRAVEAGAVVAGNPAKPIAPR